MTNPNKGRTVEQADELVQELGLLSLVEDYELTENEHTYTLFDGAALIVPVNEDEEPNVLVDDGEEISVERYKELMNN